MAKKAGSKGAPTSGGASVVEAGASHTAHHADDLAWVDAGKGYSLALDGDKLVCRNKAGKRLSSVPKEVRDGEAAEHLLALREWLDDHERECRQTVEAWMLRSLPVPRAALQAVWPDEAWRAPLENAVVARSLGDGSAGFLRGADPARGVGLVDLDGETTWLDSTEVVIPHPILLPDLDDLRALATELSLTQALSQLFRETHRKPADMDPARTSVTEHAGGQFKQLVHALGKCRSLGFRVQGGFALCRVWEAGRTVEARYWLHGDSPEEPAETGELFWVDDRERTLKLGEVGPVAYSEGVRMASSIYAARVIEKDEEQ